MTTLGLMLQDQLVTIWKIVAEKFCITRLIAQTMPFQTTICSGQCKIPSLEYGSQQYRLLNIGLIHSWLASGRRAFGMESINYKEDEKIVQLHMDNTLNNTIVFTCVSKINVQIKKNQTVRLQLFTQYKYSYTHLLFFH